MTRLIPGEEGVAAASARQRAQRAEVAGIKPLLKEAEARAAEAADAAARLASKPIPGEPIGATDLWRTTVRAAKLRCECAGTCGRKHTKSGGRCDNGLHKNPWAHGLADRLYVALRGTRHVAMCGECTDGHTRADKRAAKEAADGRAELFALPGLGLNDHRAP